MDDPVKKVLGTPSRFAHRVVESVLNELKPQRL